MTLKTSLIAVRKHKAGEPVGYGGTWVSEKDTYLGVIAIGYGDGYPRSAPSGTLFGSTVEKCRLLDAFPWI